MSLCAPSICLSEERGDYCWKTKSTNARLYSEKVGLFVLLGVYTSHGTLTNAAHNLNRSRCVMIGDRLDTDVAFGKTGGIRTLMVETGVHAREDFAKDGAKVKPDYLLRSFGDLSILKASKTERKSSEVCLATNSQLSQESEGNLRKLNEMRSQM